MPDAAPLKNAPALFARTRTIPAGGKHARAAAVATAFISSGIWSVTAQAAIDWLAKTLVRILRSKGFNRKSSAPARLPAIIFFRSASTTQ